MAALDLLDRKVFPAPPGAAKRLRVDPSTVSRLAHLVSTLGIALIERVPSGLRLSEPGQRLLGHAERTESAVIAMGEEVSPSAAQASVRWNRPQPETAMAMMQPHRVSRHYTRLQPSY